MKGKNKMVWAISLFIISITAIILIGFKLLGTELPDAAIRIIGVIDIIAIPILAYTTIKNLNNNKNMEENKNEQK